MEDNRFRVINCMPEFCNEYCSEFSEDIEALRTGGPGEEHKTIIALKCYHQEACKKAAEFAVKNMNSIIPDSACSGKPLKNQTV